jgi:A/G-specific adenine glycosylase
MVIKNKDTPSAIRNAMIHWYDNHRRDLPWRSNPDEKPNPYHVWMSEIMLQQTTVGAVKSYFENFISIWPTIENLAAAKQEDVMREWAGLGYYSRARNLHKCAQVIVDEHNGQFPIIKKSLMALPGIGDYTSSAILSIAFDVPSTVIDGNVDRVVSRLYAIKAPLPKSKPMIRDYADVLFMGENTDRPSCFAQSMMDLGATICIPKAPRCLSCPILKYCMAYKTENPGQFPFKEKKKPVPEKHAIVYLVINNGRVEIETRDEKGMLGGMIGFPTTEWVDVQDALPTENYDESIKVRHVFTHFALTLYPVIRDAKSENSVDFQGIDSIGLPTLFKKVWKLMKHKIDVIE